MSAEITGHCKGLGMDSDQGMAERGPARSGPRDSLFLLTNLTSNEGTPLGRARVRNLSATGLMADCERRVPAGAGIVLELRGVGRVSGRVVWSREDKIGIAFDREIDPQLARKPVNSGASGRTPSYLRLHQIGR
jgi:hypothetical protein